MLLNKELMVGFFGSGNKRIAFNVAWNTGTVVVTAYQPGDPIGQNELDRPRINTWRSDGTNVVYMSAGNAVYNPQSQTISYPWGDRTGSSEVVNITLRGSLSAGVDLFTDKRYKIPALFPSITQWVSSDTGNLNEIKWQYSVNRYSSQQQDVSIFLEPFWIFDSPAPSTSLTNFSVTTNPAVNTTVYWGISSNKTTISSGATTSYTY
jgi:hypothetical protein